MTDQIYGRHFTVSPNSARFFSAMCTRLENGYWGVYGCGNEIMRTINPHPVSHYIIDFINKDVRSGKKRNRFAQLQLGCHYGCFFFLEGGLTLADLQRAVENETFIDIPEVNVNSYTLTIRILDHDRWDIATADREGNAL